MIGKYNQLTDSGSTRFSKAPVAGVEFSRMTSNPKVLTTFNAGDIVPLACWEVLPHDTFSVSVDFVNRLASAVIKPTMGTMEMDLYAFFVPNRIINDSWKNVQGENTSGVWTAPEITLAPLVSTAQTADIAIPVGSVADYYGFPTQAPILKQHLQRCHDLKFRGYLDIYNNYFRDQNYEPPIPFSKLNIYNGFMTPVGSVVGIGGEHFGATNRTTVIYANDSNADGSYPDGAITKAIYGEGQTPYGENAGQATASSISGRITSWSCLDRPLKANKLHDAFTSVLPSPQKGPDIYFGVARSAPLNTSGSIIPFDNGESLRFGTNTIIGTGQKLLALQGQNNQNGGTVIVQDASSSGSVNDLAVTGTNLYVDLSNATGVSINDLRTAVATQHVYETLARSGSRYISVLRAMFDLDVDNPFSDIPQEIGHIRRELDLFQVAQTSASQAGNTAQGDLAAFGYTSNGGSFFDKTFVEHGYIHILCVVRHRNVYTTLLAPDNFRMSTLDFYLPELANIGEQPIRLATLNPFIADEDDRVLGYQEAWWEYRYQPDVVSGLFRSGINSRPNENLPGLDVWTYADPFEPNFKVVNKNWLKSNSQAVLDRTLAVTSALSDQFLGMFSFKVTKQRPMPTYSVPGLDVL